MSDVVFITPNMNGEEKSQPVGILLLATILKNKGIDCDIVHMFQLGDVESLEVFLQNAVDALAEKKPKIVSFYCRCDTYHIVLRLAEKIKTHLKDTYIVLGGPQADIVSEKTVENIPWVDFVCCGEGENTVYPFFSSLLAGTPDVSVPGLVYMKDGVVHKNPRPELVADLDTLPMLDYSMFTFDETNKRVSIDVGRGCPFNCTFCSTNSFWGRKYRLKSPQRICQEVKYLHDNYGKTEFNFNHDMFTLDRKRVMETCDLIKTITPPVTWGCSSRLDFLDEELMDYMADAGMVGVYIGVETGSPRMQKIIKKNLNLDKMMPVAEYMKKIGKVITTSFIYGFPDETEEDVLHTTVLIKKLLHLGNVTVQTHLCAFQEGTELTNQYVSGLTPIDIVSDHTGNHAVEECQDLIAKYPDLFRHMMEYKTELRSKLKYYNIFIYVWGELEPVYWYISEKYTDARLMEMYYDFEKANYEILKDVIDPYKGDTFSRIRRNDNFLSLFSDDENYELLKDVKRFIDTAYSDAVQSGEEVTEIFCFHPGELKKKALHELTKGVAVVTWKNKKRYVQFYPENA